MHANLYGYERTITDNDLAQFIKIEYARVGADTSITPREIIRDFIELLDIVWQIQIRRSRTCLIQINSAIPSQKPFRIMRKGLYRI